MSGLSINWTASTLIFYAVNMFSSFVIFSAITVFTGTISFWAIKSEEIVSLLTNNNYGLKNYTDYPITIYNKGIGFLLTFVIPYAFTGYYPVASLLGKSLAHPAYAYLSPLIALVTGSAAYLFWNCGLKHYNSAGA
jgi:ABC-2 type transport system permease protein